jgi:hypothetical protein
MGMTVGIQKDIWDIFQQIINQHLIVITTAVIYFTVTTNGPINSGIGTVTIVANYSDAVF